MQSAGSFILLLGVLVTVHELGHFLVAKACGVKVLKFSIGFGPRIFGFTRGETEYRVAWIPLGGYVRMAGEVPYEELPPEEAKRGFLAQPPWKRALIVAAGPVFNLVFPILIYFFVFVGAHQVDSARVGGVEPGAPAAIAGIKPGDRIVSIDGEPVRRFTDVMRALESRYDRDVPLSVEREGTTINLTVRPIVNEEQNPIETTRRGMIGISRGRPPLVGVVKDSPGYAAGLRTFDRITHVNGKAVEDEAALMTTLEKTEGRISLELVRQVPLKVPGVGGYAPRIEKVEIDRQPGEGLAVIGAERADLFVGGIEPGSPLDRLGVRPGDRLVAINGKPQPSIFLFNLAVNALKEEPFQLTWRSVNGEEKMETVRQVNSERHDEYNQTISSLDLGLRPYGGPQTGVEGEMITLRMGPLDALKLSLEVVPEIIGKTAKVIVRLFTGQVAFENVGGPLSLYTIASKTAEKGLEYYLDAMAAISVNLGLMNLLPIPILDGFHLLAALWEGVRRRPIPMRAREIANMVGLAMLVLLMVMVLRNDISKLMR
jgi:regulator of sigma E protease